MRRCVRGSIYFADLSPVIGSEQGGRRPVLVLQNDIGNRYSPTVIVAPISGRPDSKPRLPTHCYVCGDDALENPSVVLLEQIRTVDKCRLERYIGTLDSTYMKEVDRALAVSVGLDSLLAGQ